MISISRRLVSGAIITRNILDPTTLLFVQKCIDELPISHVIDIREIVFVHSSYHINAATPKKFIAT